MLQPVKRDGEVLTYCAGISSYDKESLAKVVQTRCAAPRAARARPAAQLWLRLRP